MQRHLQLELTDEFRCRLAVPFIYVPNIHIGWDWDPDALARWSTLISSRLVLVNGQHWEQVKLHCWGRQELTDFTDY